MTEYNLSDNFQFVKRENYTEIKKVYACKIGHKI